VSATYLDGASCADEPYPCATASDTVSAAAGGTVETPDTGASITFPPGCLSDDETITIDEAGWPSQVELFLDEGTGETLASYTFGPDDLTFCSDAELCMSVDVTDLTEEQRAELTFARKDKICIRGISSRLWLECTSHEWCGTDGICSARRVPITTEPSCEFEDDDEGNTTARCCINIDHFSDYALVAPLGDDIPIVCIPCVLPVALLVVLGGTVYFGRRRISQT
jgi:hypothetical protein